jgi:chaperone modulatory protein CbpM
MTLIQVEWAWMGTRETINQHDLSDCCGMTELDLEELIEYSALVPVVTPDGIPDDEAGRMRADFDLDIFTVALLLAKMSRIEILEREVLALQAQMPFHAL